MNTRFLRTILSGLLLLQAASSVCADDELSPRLSRTNLLSYRNASGEVVPIKSVADWSKRRAAILVGMQRVMGPLPGSEKRCPLDPQITEEVNCGDYVRRLISYASQPGSRVPAYLLIPKRALSGSGKFPAVLALHQTHEAGQKVVVGLGESPNDEYGVALAKRGFVVLAPPYTMLANYWPDVKALGYQSGTMKAIWDNMRALDLLESLPEVDGQRMGCIGHSLGGHNTMFTAAFDPRIKALVSNCGFTRFHKYYGGKLVGWTSPRYMPLIASKYQNDANQVPFDFPEIIALFAPRPFLASSPISDSNFEVSGVRDAIASAQPIYALYGKADQLQANYPNSTHDFPEDARNVAYGFLDKYLK